MEYLSRLLKGLKEDKKFKYHPKCSKLDITHLCFADDLLLFARGDLESIKAVQRCFTEFSQASGLQANLSKSSIYCGGVQQEVKTTNCAATGIQDGRTSLQVFRCAFVNQKDVSNAMVPPH